MNFIKKHLVCVSTFLGIVFGYIILHPFVDIVNQFFHRHKEEYIHFHWDEILTSIANSFELAHWPIILSHVILSGIVGYFFGKTINAYRTLNEQLKKFSIIGVNASSIIHDLNNPLVGISGYAQLLKSEVGNPEQISDCEKIEKEAARLSKMIMDIKMVAQGTEAIKLSKTPTELESFLEDIVSKMNLHCKINIDAKFKGQASIDKDYFERVFWNLIKDADEALGAAEKGRIEISINESNNSVVICISDNGPGISPKILKHLFKLGQTFGKKGGSGIGLYNCRKIVEAHGGKIWLVSEVNKGTVVHIKIPK